jgi:5-(carboxyamino)imidazole ribonucleotide synthase
MSAQAAQRLGYAVVVLDSDPLSPASQITPFRVPQAWNSVAGTLELAASVSVITLENEWVLPSCLEKAEQGGCRTYPQSNTLQILGDKLLQRQCFYNHSLPSPKFRKLSSWDDAHQASTEWGLPLVLKSRKGGYDGYGVKIIRNAADWAKVDVLEPKEWYAEEHIAFDRELAVMISRAPSGGTAIYPVVESRQTVDGNRCDLVIAPAPSITEVAESMAKEIALRAVEAVVGVGLFGVELFAVGDRMIVNEIAPRPHNSGHYTMDGCITSQFEQHIRSICDLPLGPTDLLAPVVVMANLLAPSDGLFDLRKATAAALCASSDLHLHWYGKQEMRIGRKMGHMNLLGKDIQETISRAIAARAAFWKGLT